MKVTFILVILSTLTFADNWYTFSGEGKLGRITKLTVGKDEISIVFEKQESNWIFKSRLSDFDNTNEAYNRFLSLLLTLKTTGVEALQAEAPNFNSNNNTQYITGLQF